MNTIAQRLKFIREQKHLSQAEAARLLDLPQQAVLSRYENGTRCPKSQRLRDFARFYGVNFNWLAFGEGKERD